MGCWFSVLFVATICIVAPLRFILVLTLRFWFCTPTRLGYVVCRSTEPARGLLSSMVGGKGTLFVSCCYVRRDGFHGGSLLERCKSYATGHIHTRPYFDPAMSNRFQRSLVGGLNSRLLSFA